MGHRANYVVIEKGKAKAFTDSWGALGCTYALADGPATCRKLATAMEPTPELMDWAFAEAGFLLDYDDRRAIFFGVPEALEDGEGGDLDADDFLAALDDGPAELFAWVADAWKGWTLVWDERGVDAFADALAAKGITSITCQPPSYPKELKSVRVEVAIDARGKPAKKAARKKAVAKKAVAKKAVAKKAVVKKAVAKKAVAKKKPATRRQAR
jgi:hypothetical protein